ncbi:MAG: lipid II flippase MurJ, partial [Candidatus Limnocylindrales bacterium]
GVVGGAAANMGIQAAALLRGRFTYRPRLELSDPAARTVLLLIVPRAFGLAAVQITFLVNNAFASGLGEGAVTVYNVAFTMLQIPIGVVGVPLSIVLLPERSRALAAGARDRFAHLSVRAPWSPR